MSEAIDAELPGAEFVEAAAFTASYYTGTARRFGATPPGVDWSCAMTQQMRFMQLLRVCGAGGSFSLNDLGCGYGALLDFLDDHHPSCGVDYRGVDLSAEMVRLARLRHPSRAERFRLGSQPFAAADFSVASGVFNVRSGQPLPAWERVVRQTLRLLAGASRRGFAVNLLAPLPGRAPRPELYAVEPEHWAGFCRSHLGATVEIVSGYGMAEFTLLVRPRRHEPFSSAWAPASSGR